MLKGKLFYIENDDTWILKTENKDRKVNTLIYGLADLGIEFDGDGEEVCISIIGNIE